MKNAHHCLSFSSVQSSGSVVSWLLRPYELQQASLSITNSWNSLKLMSIVSVMPSSHLILCRPLLLLPPIPPSIRLFSNESTLRTRWPKYWSNQSFQRKPRADLLAVQGTLKNLLQYHSSNASVLQRSAFFTVQLSHPYMTTGKTIYKKLNHFPIQKKLTEHHKSTTL